jgi:ribosome biogenesis GTPase / thiamine phosphate phosphatase
MRPADLGWRLLSRATLTMLSRLRPSSAVGAPARAPIWAAGQSPCTAYRASSALWTTKRSSSSVVGKRGWAACGCGWAAAAHAQRRGWAAAASPSRRPRRRPAAAATAPDAAAPEEQPQQHYALGQVMTAQANFVRVRLRRALPPGSALPPLGDRQGDEALLRLWQQQEEGGVASPPASSPPPPLLLCTVRGLLKKLGQPVLVGDRVVVATTKAAAAAAGGATGAAAAASTTPISTTTDRGVVARVLPAARPPLRDPPVANADHVVLLLSLARPPFEPLAASRFLVSVAASGLPVTIALNKCDLVSSAEAEQRLEQVQSWGYREPGQVVRVSCETGEGVAALARRLGGGRTSVVAGPSGAGKSSLINALLSLSGNAAAASSDALLMEQDEEEALFGLGEEGEQEDEEDEDEADDDDDEDGSGGLFGRPSCSDDEDDEDDDKDDERFVGLVGGGTTDLGGADARPSRPSSTPLQLAVGAVSDRSGRGRHTTRTVTLVPVPAAVVGGFADDKEEQDNQQQEGGLLADTPGFSMPSLDGVSSAALGALFPDFVAAQERAAAAAAAGEDGTEAASSSSYGTPAASATGCRFTDCLHVAEPGCAVLAAVEAAMDAADGASGLGGAGLGGGGNGGADRHHQAAAYVDPERLEHYYRFLSEAREREAQDVRAMQEAKRRREGLTKVVVGRGGAVRQEARLDGRKHRAVSRRSGKQEAMRAMMTDDDDEGEGGVDEGDDDDEGGRRGDGGGGERVRRRRGGGGGGARRKRGG